METFKSVLIILIGPAVFLLLINDYRCYFILISTSETSEAFIVDKYYDSISGSEDVYYIGTFKVNGKNYKVKNNIGFGHIDRRYKPGEKINVVFSPGNPSLNRIDSFIEMHLAVLINSIIIIFFVSFGLIRLIRSK